MTTDSVFPDSTQTALAATADLLSRAAADLAALAQRLTRKRPAPTPAPTLPEYLTTAQAAALLGMSKKGLEQMRARGCGPPFVRVGKAIRYPREMLRILR